MYRNILVATDGTALSDVAVSHAVALAAGLHARLVILTATEPFHLLTTEADQIADTEEEYRRLAAQRAGHILDAAAEKAAAAGVEAARVHVESDHPHAAILDIAATERCDLIVMASHGRSWLAAALLGSETEEVLAGAAVPLLVVRPGTPPA